MYEIAWKEITARGRIVCKRRAFRSESDRETRCGRGADPPEDVHPLSELS